MIFEFEQLVRDEYSSEVQQEELDATSAVAAERVAAITNSFTRIYTTFPVTADTRWD